MDPYKSVMCCKIRMAVKDLFNGKCPNCGKVPKELQEEPSIVRTNSMADRKAARDFFNI